MTVTQAKILISVLLLVPMILGYLISSLSEKGSGYLLVSVSLGLLLSAAFILLVMRGSISVKGLEIIVEEKKSDKSLIASMILMICVLLVFIVASI